jgi:hypothetical protein
MDEKEQAWLRLKCFEIVIDAKYQWDNSTTKTMADDINIADHLYRWATTGKRNGCA